MGHEEKVNCVPRQNRDQGVHEVTHCRFRHRTSLLRSAKISCRAACC